MSRRFRPHKPDREPRDINNYTPLHDGDKDHDTPCVNCDELPTVHPTQLCGPCCFGEADTAGGNW